MYTARKFLPPRLRLTARGHRLRGRGRLRPYDIRDIEGIHARVSVVPPSGRSTNRRAVVRLLQSLDQTGKEDMSLLATLSAKERRQFLAFASRYRDLRSAWDAWEERKRSAERSSRRTADPAAASRKRELSPTEVESRIASEIETLKAQAVAPVVEEVDPDVVAADERKLREERRRENLRRMTKSAVLVQVQPDGSTKFVHDKEVRERPFGSGAHESPGG
jgi:hypothetical protein